MSIRPLDMQVMVPKLNEVAQIQHLEQQKAGINQQEIGIIQDRKNDRAQKTVERTYKDDLLKNNADAKEKGKNQYYYKGRKREEQNKIKKDSRNISRNRIDIKI